jgi:hypothetical protein
MMERETIFRELLECSEVAPEIRVGQLLDFLSVLANARQNKNLTELEDDELLALVTEHRIELANRASSLAAA